MSPRDRLALAADLPLGEAKDLYQRISPYVGWAKVGLSLFVEHGPEAVQPFLRLGAKVFLDLKLHDIPNTVELAARKAGALGVGLLTVHASGGEAMLRAAVNGAREGASRAGFAAPKVLAVTVLTSMSAPELTAIGVPQSPEDQVLRLAKLSQRAGVDGLVCSAREASTLRQALGPGLFLCTPGIRPVGAQSQDQSRVETPASAIRSGSDLLVVGRPIYSAPDPLSAAAALAAEVSFD